MLGLKKIISLFTPFTSLVANRDPCGFNSDFLQFWNNQVQWKMDWFSKFPSFEFSWILRKWMKTLLKLFEKIILTLNKKLEYLYLGYLSAVIIRCSFYSNYLSQIQAHLYISKNSNRTFGLYTGGKQRYGILLQLLTILELFL